MARKKLTISLTEETIKSLDARAEYMGVSRSAVIEVALRRIFSTVDAMEGERPGWFSHVGSGSPLDG
jgi:metal-responsive CopG/Arc/MetJ family transcriptional regulator